MKQRFNWMLWAGLLLAVVGFVSYFAFFSRFPVTRDVPWVNVVLLLVAAALLVIGWRRAPRKIVASIVAVLGFVVIGAFTAYVVRSDVPPSSGAPAVGEKAPAFVLPDTANRMVSLDDALSGSNGVLLVFYRGYW